MAHDGAKPLEPPRLDHKRTDRVSFAVPRNGRKIDPAKPASSRGTPKTNQTVAEEPYKTPPQTTDPPQAPQPQKAATDKRKVEDEPTINQTMAEPPSKRARRTDSFAVGGRNDTSAQLKDRDARDTDARPSGRDRDRNYRGDHTRGSGREGRGYRSRSRDRNDRKRDRSRSRERDRARDGTREREDLSRRERDRSRSRERYRSRRDPPSTKSDRQKDRSRSPPRNGISSRHRSPPRGPRSDRPKDAPRDEPDRNGSKDSDHKQDKKGQSAKVRDSDKMQVDQPGTVEELDEEGELMKRLMGFTTFRSTQNTKVPGNNVYGLRKEKKTEYRQYMNRQGGFNRPLSPSR